MSETLQFLIVLAIILVAAKVSGILAVRVGQPAVLGELAAGVVLGPSAIDLFGFGFLDSPAVEESIHLLAELGVIFLMFLAGLETNLDEVNKVRRVAILAGVMGVVFPLGLGAAGTLPFGFELKEALFVGIILSATSVSISARTLMELGVLQGRQGISILAAAVIDDILVILVLSFFIAFGGGEEDGGGAVDALLIVGRVVLFFGAAWLIGRLVLPRLARWSSGTQMSEGVLVTAIVVILLYAWFAEYVGEVALITGAFLAGVLLRPTEVHRVIDEKMHAISYGFFVPIFFVSVGLAADAGAFEASDIAFLAVVCGIAIASKVVGCGLGALLAGESMRSSLQIGTGMISRGEVGLIVASVGLTQGLIENSTFSVMVLMVLVTTLVTPILLKAVFSGEREAQHA